MGRVSFQIIIYQFLFFISLNVEAVVRQDEFSCQRPNPAWALEDVARWAEEMDIIGNRAIRNIGNGDQATSFNNPIDRSCFKDLNETQWNTRLQKIEEAMARALTGSQRCEATLGLHMRPMLHILRRSRLHCFTKGANADGMLTLASANNGGMTSPTSNHRYNMNLNTKYLDKASVEELASTLVHEALHWTKHNNTDWHNHTGGRDRETCNNSLFEDRVYMMTAACFPDSKIGKKFYGVGGAHSCPEICQTALTSSDSGAVHWTERLFQHGSDGRYGGRMGARDAEFVCQRISQVPRKYARAKETQALIKRRHRLFIDYLKRYPEAFESQEGSALRIKLNLFFKSAADIFDSSADRQGNYRRMMIRARQMQETLAQKCRAPIASNWVHFCGQWQFGQDPVSREIRSTIIKVEDLKLDDINLYPN